MALSNSEWGVRGGEGNRRQGENISRASAPWSRGGFVVDLVGGEGESVMVDGVTFFFFFSCLWECCNLGENATRYVFLLRWGER